MVKLIAPVLALIMTAEIATAQMRSRVVTHPGVPSVEALNRLNMKLAWKTYLTVDDSRDGLETVQVVGDRIYVQLRNGTVAALDADTGRQLWLSRVGQPYRITLPLGFNLDTVFGLAGTHLYALDRATGRLLWDINLPNVPATGPVADSQHVYLCLNNNRLVVYRLPNLEMEALRAAAAAIVAKEKEKAKPAEPARSPIANNAGSARSGLGSFTGSESWAASPLTSKAPPVTYSPLASATDTARGDPKGYQIPLIWAYASGSRLGFAPVVSLRKTETPGYLLVTTERGVVYGSTKHYHQLNFSFQADSAVSAPLAQYGDIAYLASEDATLVAINIETSRQVWRIPVGGTVRIRPEVTDEDIYLTPERAGLYRINRATGDVVWQNPRAERFLSANRKYVYALSASGQLLVLDRARGTQLSTYDVRDFNVPITNDYTDRLFLAANDGLVICLYDKEYGAPLWNKQLVEEKKPEERRRMEKIGDKPEAKP